MDTNRTTEITSQIFKNATLIAPTIGFWHGRQQQDDDDLKAQGVAEQRIEALKKSERDDSASTFTRGFKWLVPKAEIDKFVNVRTSLQSYMNQISYDFPLRGVRFVPLVNVDAVLEQLRERQARFYQLRDDFCVRFPALRDTQIEAYLETCKESFETAAKKKVAAEGGELQEAIAAEREAYRQHLIKCYPSIDVIRSKFNFDWTVFSWAITNIQAIAQQEGERFRVKMADFLGDCARALRQEVKQAAEGFIEAMQNAKVKVNEKSVDSFRNFLDRFQKLNFMNDFELEQVVKEMRAKFENVDTWNKEDIDIADISATLHRVVEIAQNEGADQDVVAGYIRRIEVDLEIPAEEIAVDAASFVSPLDRTLVATE